MIPYDPLVSLLISTSKLKELKKLLYVEHEHGESMNKCPICDEDIFDAIIRELKNESL